MNTPYSPYGTGSSGIPYLQPQEEDDLLSKLAGGALSGLSFVGHVLDTPGSFVRNIIGGQNPFPGIFDPTQRLSGRNVLENWGAVDPLDKNDDSFITPGGVAGFGLELLTDPLLMLSPLSKAGKIAKGLDLLPEAERGAAGLLNKGTRELNMTNTLGDVLGKRPELMGQAEKLAGGTGQLNSLLDSPLSGLFNVGPLAGFTGKGTALGVGETAQKIAGGLDRFGDAVRYSKPVRGLAGLFSKPNLDAESKVGQLFGQQKYKALGEADATAKGLSFEINEAAKKLGMLDMPPEVLNDALEGVTKLDGLPGEHVAFIRSKLDDYLQRLHDLGIDTNEFNVRDYLPRRATTPGGVVYGAGEREKFFDSFTKNQINQLTTDPALVGAERTINGKDALARVGSLVGYDPAEHSLLRKELKSMQGHDAELLAASNEHGINRQVNDRLGAYDMRQVNDDAIKQIAEQRAELASAMDETSGKLGAMDKSKADVKAMADWLHKSVDPFHAAEGGHGFFNNHPLHDIGEYMRWAERKLAGGDATLDFLAKNVGAEGANHVPLKDALKELGFNFNDMGHEIPGEAADLLDGASAAQQVRPPRGAYQQMAERTELPIGEVPDAVVPRNIVDEAARTVKALQAPESASWLINKLDDATRLFKVGVTAWPGTKIRNWYQGVAQNIFGDMYSTAAQRAADQFARHGAEAAIPGVEKWAALKAAGAENPQEAMDVLRKMIHSSGLTETGIDRLGDATSSGKKLFKDATDIQHTLTGPQFSAKTDLLDPLKTGTFKPWDISGFNGRTQTTFKPALMAENAERYVENANRLTGFFEKLRQGWSPESAAAHVKAWHGDFNNLTKFEKGFMRRVAPFYNWQRQQIPQIIGDLIKNPGGKMAQAIRLENQGRSKDEFIPEQVAEGLAIPLGKNENGTQRYLNKIDLAHEDILNLFHPGRSIGNMLTETGMEALSNLTPYAKAPLELATGKQFNSGRDLADLDSRIGRVTQALTGSETSPRVPIPLEEALMNSPAARLLTTAGTLVDSRKGIGPKAVNMLTGARITDVDTTKAKQIAARDAIEEMLKNAGGKQFNDIYMSPDKIAQLSPEEYKAYQGLRTLQAANSKASREKKKAAAGK